jgi:hypothetical protein
VQGKWELAATGFLFRVIKCSQIDGGDDYATVHTPQTSELHTLNGTLCRM